MTDRTRRLIASVQEMAGRVGAEFVPDQDKIAVYAGPRRIQRKRSKGWRMPENTVYVGRPTKWGNPFIVGKPGGAYTAKVQNQRHAWQLYRSIAIDNAQLIAAAKAELRGKNLACFCPLPTEPYADDCCHAAVLLHLANSAEKDGSR